MTPAPFLLPAWQAMCQLLPLLGLLCARHCRWGRCCWTRTWGRPMPGAWQLWHGGRGLLPTMQALHPLAAAQPWLQLQLQPTSLHWSPLTLPLERSRWQRPLLYPMPPHPYHPPFPPCGLRSMSLQQTLH